MRLFFISFKIQVTDSYVSKSFLKKIKIKNLILKYRILDYTNDYKIIKRLLKDIGLERVRI